MGRRWFLFDLILAIVGGLCSLLGIFTGIKRADYDQEQNYKDLEERYGLTPVSKEEEA